MMGYAPQQEPQVVFLIDTTQVALWLPIGLSVLVATGYVINAAYTGLVKPGHLITIPTTSGPDIISVKWDELNTLLRTLTTEKEILELHFDKMVPDTIKAMEEIRHAVYTVSNYDEIYLMYVNLVAYKVKLHSITLEAATTFLQVNGAQAGGFRGATISGLANMLQNISTEGVEALNFINRTLPELESVLSNLNPNFVPLQWIALPGLI